MAGLKRGDVVLVALQGDYGKPRPAVVVQGDLFEAHSTVTILPLTSGILAAPLFRITIEPAATNGLQLRSQVMVDKPYTVARAKIGARIGELDAQTLFQVNRSMMVWLGLP